MSRPPDPASVPPYGQNDVLQPYDLPVTGGGARKTLEVHQRVGQ